MPGCETSSAESQIAVFADAEAVFVDAEICSFGLGICEDGLRFQIRSCHLIDGFALDATVVRDALTPFPGTVDCRWERFKTFLAFEIYVADYAWRRDGDFK